MIDIAIIGSGGHCRSFFNLMNSQGFSVSGIYDDGFIENSHEMVGDYCVKGTLSDLPLDVLVCLAVGENKQRADFFLRFAASLYKENLLHKTALIERYVTLGISNQVFANTYINAYVSIGDNNIINTGSILEHEVQIGSHNHISVGAIICGRVKVGDRCFIGAGSVIKDGVSICSNVTIGAGATVVKNITEEGVYVGCPAIKIES
jgi:sugar O-acyltransferase (sialic acid O-acetyltransferase NeuD family)